MERTVNTTKALETANVIRTFSAALKIANDLADEETAIEIFNCFSSVLREFLETKSLALVIDNCARNCEMTAYSVHLFDSEDDCKYFLGGILSECRLITVEEFIELAPLDWDNLNKYKLTTSGTVAFSDTVD